MKKSEKNPDENGAKNGGEGDAQESGPTDHSRSSSINISWIVRLRRSHKNSRNTAMVPRGRIIVKLTGSDSLQIELGGIPPRL